MYLHQLPAARKSVPELLTDPIALVRDVRTLVEQHRHDKQHLAVTGVPVLKGECYIYSNQILSIKTFMYIL